jgi:hypothetical protein
MEWNIAGPYSAARRHHILSFCLLFATACCAATVHSNANPNTSVIFHSRVHRDTAVLRLSRKSDDPSTALLYAADTADAVWTEIAHLKFAQRVEDVWVSSRSRPIVCLLLIAGRRPHLHEYTVIPFLVERDAQKGRVFRSHCQPNPTDRIVDDQAAFSMRLLPLRLSLALRSRLDKDSPFRDADLPELGVRRLDALSFADREGGVSLTGILNGEWRFELELVVDEKEERLSHGRLQLERVNK